MLRQYRSKITVRSHVYVLPATLRTTLVVLSKATFCSSTIIWLVWYHSPFWILAMVFCCSKPAADITTGTTAVASTPPHLVTYMTSSSYSYFCSLVRVGCTGHGCINQPHFLFVCAPSSICLYCPVSQDRRVSVQLGLLVFKDSCFFAFVIACVSLSASPHFCHRAVQHLGYVAVPLDIVLGWCEFFATRDYVLYCLRSGFTYLAHTSVSTASLG